jgi:tRNA(Ile)-lysidine synthase
MLNQLMDFVHEQKLFQPDEQILLAVSGGIDSTVLAHLFSYASFDFGIAHCNFHLRGEESDGDETFVRALAMQYGVPVFVEHFDTEAYAALQGISIQMAARDLRRGWFEKLLISENFQKIATAHHLNDSLETAIFNLTKGTGIAGLQGILPVSGSYVRPLLFATRDMISGYARENDITWREDRSNSSLKYSRNLIRHRVIPELKKINPNLEFTFADTSEKIIAATAIFNEAISLRKDASVRSAESGFEIDKEELSRSIQPGLTLHEILAPYGFNFAQAMNIIKVMNRQPGKVFYSDNFELINDRSALLLNEITSTGHEEILVGDDDLNIDFLTRRFVFETLNSKNVQIDPDRNLAFLDMEKLQFPLKIRTWKHGDFFYPLGMKHKKKVSDFMIDEKIPVNLKSKLMVIFSGDDLIWVIGYRIDDRYKITKQTSKILKISSNIRHDQPV